MNSTYKYRSVSKWVSIWVRHVGGELVTDVTAFVSQYGPLRYFNIVAFTFSSHFDPIVARLLIRLDHKVVSLARVRHNRFNLNGHDRSTVASNDCQVVIVDWYWHHTKLDSGIDDSKTISATFSHRECLEWHTYVERFGNTAFAIDEYVVLGTKVTRIQIWTIVAKEWLESPFDKSNIVFF